MMKAKWFLISSLVVLLAVVSGISMAEAASTKPITLKVALYQPPTHLYARIWHKYEPMMEEVTGGLVKMRVFDSGSLVKQKGANFYIATQEGICDIAFPSEAAAGKDIPLLSYGYLPVWRDFKGQTDACDNGLQEIVESQLHASGYTNIKVGTYLPTGIFMIGTKKTVVRVPNDLKGLKMRSSGIFHRIFQLCGANPTNISMGEVYEGIEKGIINGSNGVITQWTDWKWMEVCDYLNMFPLGGALLSTIINNKVLEKMSETTKKQVLFVLDACVKEIRGQNVMSFYYNIQNVVPEYMEVYYPTRSETKIWRETLKPITKEWLEKAGPKGQVVLDLIEKYNE